MCGREMMTDCLGGLSPLLSCIYLMLFNFVCFCPTLFILILSGIDKLDRMVDNTSMC